MRPAGAPVWEDGDWTALPPLEGRVTADVCVVGLGGSGLAAVDELLAAGARVAAVDASAVASGAAGRNGGFLLAGTARFHHDAVGAFGRDAAGALYRATLAELARIRDTTPDVVRLTGSVRVASSAEELDDCAAHLHALAADGFAAGEYEGTEGRGIVIHGDGTCDPLRRCRVLARRAVDAGARLFERSPAVEIDRRRVRTAAGEVACDGVVVAVDGSLEVVVPELAPVVRTARLQVLATAPTDEVRVERPVYARWGYDYWQQRPSGEVVLGGFRDRFEDDEWCADPVPTEPVQAEIERFLREGVGVRRAAVTHRWAGCVAYTDDRLPVLEQVRPGVWATGAYSGTGNVLGAVCGRAAARLALGLDAPVATVLADARAHAAARHP